jgi:uncharacterized damage-inducible protein DinB
MDEKADLLRLLDAAHARMSAAVAQIDPNRAIYDGWTIRHVLAHIAGWDDTAVDFFRAHARNDESSLTVIQDVDAHNARLVEAREDLDLEQTRQAWVQARDRFKAVVRDLPPECFATDMLLPRGARGPVARLVRGLANHEICHAEEIEQLLADLTVENEGKSTMDEKTRLLQDLDDARIRMRAIVEKLGETREVYNGWTIRHVLAHLAGWDDAVTESLNAHINGAEPPVPAYRGIDAYNNLSVDTRKDLNFEQTRKECEYARDQLKAVLTGISDEKFNARMIYPWGPQEGTVTELIEVIIHHERGHAEEIETLLKDSQA